MAPVNSVLTHVNFHFFPISQFFFFSFGDLSMYPIPAYPVGVFHNSKFPYLNIIPKSEHSIVRMKIVMKKQIEIETKNGGVTIST